MPQPGWQLVILVLPWYIRVQYSVSSAQSPATVRHRPDVDWWQMRAKREQRSPRPSRHPASPHTASRPDAARTIAKAIGYLLAPRYRILRTQGISRLGRVNRRIRKSRYPARSDYQYLVCMAGQMPRSPALPAPRSAAKIDAGRSARVTCTYHTVLLSRGLDGLEVDE